MRDSFLSDEISRLKEELKALREQHVAGSDDWRKSLAKLEADRVEHARAADDLREEQLGHLEKLRGELSDLRERLPSEVSGIRAGQEGLQRGLGDRSVEQLVDDLKRKVHDLSMSCENRRGVSDEELQLLRQTQGDLGILHQHVRDLTVTTAGHGELIRRILEGSAPAFSDSHTRGSAMGSELGHEDPEHTGWGPMEALQKQQEESFLTMRAELDARMEEYMEVAKMYTNSRVDPVVTLLFKMLELEEMGRTSLGMPADWAAAQRVAKLTRAAGGLALATPVPRGLGELPGHVKEGLKSGDRELPAIDEAQGEDCEGGPDPLEDAAEAIDRLRDQRLHQDDSCLGPLSEAEESDLGVDSQLGRAILQLACRLDKLEGDCRFVREILEAPSTKGRALRQRWEELRGSLLQGHEIGVAFGGLPETGGQAKGQPYSEDDGT